jgi:hypothetical protein
VEGDCVPALGCAFVEVVDGVEVVVFVVPTEGGEAHSDVDHGDRDSGYRLAQEPQGRSLWAATANKPSASAAHSPNEQVHKTALGQGEP